MTRVEQIGQGSEGLAEELGRTFLFESFSADQLSWLLERAEEVWLEAGEVLFGQQTGPEHLWVLLDGEWRLTREVSGREVVLEVSTEPGSWAGWLPMFDGAVGLTARVVRPTRLLRIPREATRQMIDAGFPVAKHLMAGLYTGITRFSEMTRQQEKLAALGKLSAGLAHELNNPASAARRAATQLRGALREQDTRALALGRYLDEAQMDFIIAYRQGVIDRAANLQPLDPITFCDREDELLPWLENRGVPDPWEITPALINGGLALDELRPLGATLPDEAVADAVCWLGASLAVAALAGEIEASTTRIAELVKAVKDYTFMDQAPIQEVDVNRGLESTLTILGHRLREQGIELVRDYAGDLPAVSAYGSELNQVWTNLLDNAIDALTAAAPANRRITVRTSREREGVMVEVADNGPGIPDEIQDRIFEPFFSTKGVGAGTGLGLDAVYRIVVVRHQGEIEVESKPGETRFMVYLPRGAARSDA